MSCFGGDAEQERKAIANAPQENTEYGDNTITNTKYTWYNFLVLNLVEQFR